ncbi:MAG: SGNH/GDSL hydrolase family protein [Lachnospiraceae bacterium]|nr:SGNH/GDSL hydrolase family protein [Lachnospiraceae bacterium]
MKIWCAIGDSFTYLNDHLDETGYRLHKGYVSRTLEKIMPELGTVHVINRGINGAATENFLDAAFPSADFYTILLGTNDWFSFKTPCGTKEDFDGQRPGTIVGNLACIIRNIRKTSTSPVIVMNPVERSDFIYILDHQHIDHGSYAPEAGQKLSDVAGAIFSCVHGERVYPINLHDRSGFTVANAVKFQRKRVNGKETDLAYPDYIGVPYDPDKDEYPYPEQAIGMTYDGLHPSDEGADIIAGILAEEILKVIYK